MSKKIAAPKMSMFNIAVDGDDLQIVEILPEFTELDGWKCKDIRKYGHDLKYVMLADRKGEEAKRGQGQLEDGPIKISVGTVYRLKPIQVHIHKDSDFNTLRSRIKKLCPTLFANKSKTLNPSNNISIRKMITEDGFGNRFHWERVVVGVGENALKVHKLILTYIHLDGEAKPRALRNLDYSHKLQISTIVGDLMMPRVCTVKKVTKMTYSCAGYTTES